MKITAEIEKWMINIRRTIHRNPELAYNEFKTADLIKKELKKLKISYRDKLGKTGIAATFGNTKKKIIGFRADMDALPILENVNELNKDYHSKIDGIMHACGHDSHVAIMLGVAKILSQSKDFTKNNGAKFFFQPAEEDGPGALEMIKDGALENPKPDVVFAGHILSSLECGHIALIKGAAHASTDTIKIKIKGKGGHAANPDKTIDPIVATSTFIMQLQTIISRNINALDHGVITIGSIHGGTIFNIIPEEVELQGTIRAHDKKIRDLMVNRVKKLLKSIDLGFGTKSSFEIMASYPLCYNDENLTEFAYETAVSLFGEKKVHWWTPSMGGEDFAYFGQNMPSTMIRIGTRNKKKGIIHPAHSDKFNIDEAAIPIATELFTELAMRYCK